VTSPDKPAEHPTPRAAPVDDLAVLQFDGPDATTFLQGQLSSDVAALAPGTLQRSTYNSPKGRVLASLVLARPDGGDGFRAVVAADLAASMARRLAMYVLRAKVKVASLADERALIGVAGAGAVEAVRAAFGVAVAPGAAVAHETLVLLGLPDGRVLVDVPVAPRPGPPPPPSLI
jgi:folate-binding Fe-S cluster repair protein YgfZ